MTDTKLVPLEPAHFDAVADLITRANRRDGVPEARSLEEMEELLDEPHFTPTDDARVAVVDGVPVGYAEVWYRPSTERHERAYVTLFADPWDPEVAGRLLDWAEARAEERLLGSGTTLDKHVLVDADERPVERHRLLVDRGFAPVRHNDTLTRDLRLPIPEVATSGFVVQPWDAARSEELRQVCIAAFRDHWGSTPIDRATWDSWMGRTTTRLDLSFFAEVDGAVVGYIVNSHYPADTALTGRHEAWVDSLGTLRSARGRGVATALLAVSMRTMRDAGFDSVGLDVDTENLTGAHRLYENLGFVRTARTTIYSKQVA